MKKKIILSILCLILASCASAKSYSLVAGTTPVVAVISYTKPEVTPQPSLTPTEIPAAQVDSIYGIPNFEHIILIVLENQYLQNVIGNPRMPILNALAKNNVLFTNYHAVAHPSLPNYLAMISGSTQNITTNCTDCFVDQPNLTDGIEASGRTWKAYFEDIPSPCFVGNKKPYGQMINPFIYFNSIRLNTARCERSIVPLTQLEKDLSANQLPNFAYIAPNLCNSGHDCSVETADNWVGSIVTELQNSPALGENSLIIVTFDEGVEQNYKIDTSGEITTILISPLARQGFVDPTRYSHYSLLKTILSAWNLPELGQTVSASTNVMMEPWSNQVGLIYPRALTITP
jgi:hypothetical protein